MNTAISQTLDSRSQISRWSSPSLARQFAVVLGGVIGLSLLAQVSLRLPFTPVPLTGQTFGAYLLALLYGRRLGLTTLLTYLGLGALGAPIFAQAASGLAWGPTMGYLVGMAVASWVVGGLSDRGALRTFRSAWFAALVGSVCVFTFGLLNLAFYVPGKLVFTAGLLPFIPGDLIKTALAASIAHAISPKPSTKV